LSALNFTYLQLNVNKTRQMQTNLLTEFGYPVQALWRFCSC